MKDHSFLLPVVAPEYAGPLLLCQSDCLNWLQHTLSFSVLNGLMRFLESRNSCAYNCSYAAKFALWFYGPLRNRCGRSKTHLFCSCYKPPKIGAVLKCHHASCHPKCCCLPFFCQCRNDVCLCISNGLGTGCHFLLECARK